ncbi:MAG: guanylate kinase, partial [Pseudomonadota bacterium]|nr:guanylate kinase [Pseudomonadota bacterium]
VFEEKYGTAKNNLKSQLKSGLDVALDIDWQGARAVKTQLPNSVSVFILPPSMDALSDRLVKRGDDATQIASRMNKARSEIGHFDEYDYLIINDNFEKALIELKTIIGASRLETGIQKIRKHSQISELIEGQGRVC